MATVVLTAVGSIFGGPVGAVIGAAVGVAVDSQIFGGSGKTREGPRLGDLRVQTSRYGSAIPQLFGRVRVAGTVIWSTDLIEARSTQSGGKGGTRTNSYSYSASFAVLLSGGAVGRIGRIWADGNLLRGAAGDFKTATGFRLLTGDGDQALDPLLAAAEGLATTPAYRGRAIAVFEDFQLADYGNRIPSLSFEVIADEAPVAMGDLLSTLSDGAIGGGGGALLDGIAVTGDSVRSVAAALAEAVPISLRDNGDWLELVGAGGPVRALGREDEGAAVDDQAAPTTESRIAADKLPAALSLSYYDAARDYQPGVQAARRGGEGRGEVQVALAAVMPSERAKAIADARLASVWRERRTLTVALPWRAMDVAPGDRVTLAGDVTVWRVAAAHFERMVVRLSLVPDAGGAQTAVAADPGRALAQADRVQGPTTLVLLDLPGTSDSAAGEARVVVAANSASPGWRRAALLASSDAGASYVEMGATALPATIGRTIGALPDAGTGLIDRINAIEVQLIHPELVLHDADEAALIAGGNLAAVGRELVQFGRAVPLGSGRWRLTELWRGRRGTEAAAATHGADEAFVLIQGDALASVPVGLAVAGLRVRALGIGDGEIPAEAVLGAAGTAVTPLPPVRLAAARNADGSIGVSWIRRSREGWSWDDGVDAPIGEEREAYRVTREAVGLAALRVEVSAPGWSYPASQIAEDLAAGATEAVITVWQIGSRRESAAVSIAVNLD